MPNQQIIQSTIQPSFYHFWCDNFKYFDFVAYSSTSDRILFQRSYANNIGASILGCKPIDEVLGFLV